MDPKDLAALAALTDLESVAADQSELEAVYLTLAEHPGVPQVMREAMPALIRIQRRRDMQHAEMVRKLNELAALVTPPAVG